MNTEPLIPADTKFACISVKGIPSDIRDRIITPICGIHVFPPGEVLGDESWKESLGTIQYDYLLSSDLTIVAMQESEHPLVNDDEQKALHLRALEFFYALLLQGIPHHEGALLVMGGNAGKLRITVVQEQDRFHRFQEVDSPIITPEKVLLADRIAQGLRIAFESDESHFLRLRKGFSAWKRGAVEEMPDMRLHQFARALEAMILPDRGATTKQFVHRVQTFTGASTYNRNVIEQIYEMRSAAEHMNDWITALVGVPTSEREAIARLRAYQAEVLSSAVYIEVFSRPEVMAIFETDETMDHFWSQRDDIRLEQWSTPIEMPQILT